MNRDNVFIDVKSSNSFRSLAELVEDAFDNNVITVCQFRIGEHLPKWRNTIKGDQVIYAIDDIGCVGGEINYICKRVFRPRWMPDNNDYKGLINFAHGMNPTQFNQKWVEYMIEQHCEAINQKRWLFFVLAAIEPTYHLTHNKKFLLDKANQMIDAEEELDKEAIKWSMGECCE